MSQAFDTLAAAKTLREAEFDERQAEAITAVLRRATSANRAELATKADLKAEVGALEARIYRALWLQAAGLVAIMVGLKIFG